MLGKALVCVPIAMNHACLLTHPAVVALSASSAVLIEEYAFVVAVFSTTSHLVIPSFANVYTDTTAAMNSLTKLRTCVVTVRWRRST